MEPASRAVIRAISRNDLRLARIHARNLEGGFVRLGAGGRKEKLVQPLRKNLRQKLRQFSASRRRIAGHGVAQLLSLPRDRVNHRLVLMAKVGAHQLRRKIQVTLPCSIDDVAALGVDDVHRIPVLLESPCAVVILPGEIDNLLAGECLRFGNVSGVHDGHPIRSCLSCVTGLSGAEDIRPISQHQEIVSWPPPQKSRRTRHSHREIAERGTASPISATTTPATSATIARGLMPRVYS